MKKIIIISLVVLGIALTIAFVAFNPRETAPLDIAPLSNTLTATVESTELPTAAPPTIEVVTPTEKPDNVLNLYDCKLEMSFVSGPLEGKKSQFVVLGRNYFYDKGEKFYPGKNTAVYYEDLPYLVLHSAYENGNLLKPLEAEFIRFYLEQWGELTPPEIENKIKSLLGSDVNWSCDGETIINTTIRHIVRLSNKASEQLWLTPGQLESILHEKAGESTEWLGEMNTTEEPALYLGFCGWGPEDVGEARIYYYRYLIQFEILP